MRDLVMEGLTNLADFVAARYMDDPGGKHLASVKRAEILIERLRDALERIDNLNKFSMQDAWQNCEDMRAIARAALNHSPATRAAS